MTVRELKERLQEMENQGHGNVEIMSFWKNSGGNRVFDSAHDLKKISVKQCRWEGWKEHDDFDAHQKVFVIE